MFTRILGVIFVCLAVTAAVACGDTTPSPTPTQPTPEIEATPPPGPAPEIEPTPSEPATPVTAAVTGTITYRERIALTSDAVVKVKLSDVSRADAPAVTIGEQVIENPGQVPISFEIEYDPSDIDERFTYAVQVRIMEGDRLAFINDTAYHVITRDSPTHVDMALVKVDAAPVEPTAAAPKMVKTPAPIETVRIVASDSSPTDYIIQIQACRVAASSSMGTSPPARATPL